MQPDNPSSDQSERTFIEQARRAQLVACAIETIATLGYAQASLAEIARCAGVSKGVINYHFAGKKELIHQVVVEVFTAGAKFMQPRIEAEATATGMLRAYIESNLDFMRTHRTHILALVEILSNVRVKDFETEPNWLDEAVGILANLLRSGQEAGEFRAFDPRMMAVAIRGAIDALPAHLARHADFDVAAYARELIAVFDRATRNDA